VGRIIGPTPDADARILEPLSGREINSMSPANQASDGGKAPAFLEKSGAIEGDSDTAH